MSWAKLVAIVCFVLVGWIARGVVDRLRLYKRLADISRLNKRR